MTGTERLEREMEEVRPLFANGSFTAFSNTLIKEYLQLLTDLRSGRYSSPGLTIGHEVEGSFLDCNSFQLPNPQHYSGGIFAVVKEQLERDSQQHYSISGELGDFNFEINTTAKPLVGTVFSREEAEMTAWLRAVAAAAAPYGLTTYLSGLVETAADDQVTLQNVIQHPSKHLRYLGINHGVVSLRGEPISVALSREDRSYAETFDSIMIEAMCNSLQSHLKLENPELDFPNYANAAMIVAAPLIAVAANSPFVNSRGPFWKDSRITVFEQSIDSRTAMERKFKIERNSFPNRYYDSLGQFYAETLQNKILLPDTSFGKSPSGEQLLDYPLFRLHVGTDWRWLRPVWHGQKGQPQFMTLEFRPLSSGPTVPDMIANSVFYYGAVTGLVRTGRLSEFKARLPFSQVRENFYAAARLGLQAKLVWSQGQAVPVQSALEELLGIAKTSLGELGVDVNDTEKYLGIIGRRLVQQRAPADVKIDVYHRSCGYGTLNQRSATSAAIREAVQCSHQAFHRGEVLI